LLVAVDAAGAEQSVREDVVLLSTLLVREQLDRPMQAALIAS